MARAGETVEVSLTLSESLPLSEGVASAFLPLPRVGGGSITIPMASKRSLSFSLASLRALTRSDMGTPPSFSALPRPVGPVPRFATGPSGIPNRARRKLFSASKSMTRSSRAAKCSALRCLNARWTSLAREGGKLLLALRPRGSALGGLICY